MHRSPACACAAVVCVVLLSLQIATAAAVDGDDRKIEPWQFEQEIPEDPPANFEEFRFLRLNDTHAIDFCLETTLFDFDGKDEATILASCKRAYVKTAATYSPTEVAVLRLHQYGQSLGPNSTTTLVASLWRALNKMVHKPYVTDDLVAGNDTWMYGLNTGAKKKGESPRGSFHNYSRLKMKHDIEQLNYLMKKERLPEKYKEIVETYKKIESPPTGIPNDFSAKYWESEEALLAYKWFFPPHYAELMEGLYNRLFYYPLERAIRGKVLSPSLDAHAIQQDYFRNEPGFTYTDNLLSKKALKQVRRFCLESTMYFEHKYNYLGAYFADGFAAPILGQIAEELRSTFPKVFKGRHLQQMWAYKYDSTVQSGINLHADSAFVNVNFWITPDSAVLDKDSGGLVVWLRSAPMEWTFDDYQSPPKLAEFAKTAKKVVIPYRQNRMVFFNSNLVHATDTIKFKHGYTNRRINVTMLFGSRAGDDQHLPPPGFLG